MAKDIIFDTEKMAAGVDKLANAVKITMGPKGRTVVIEKSYGAPVATKDGVTVAKAVSLKDPQENIGARMVQEVAKKAGDDAGDGTTTATVLAQKLIREGRRVIAAGMNPMDVKRGIDMATAAVIADIDKHARPVKDSAEIAQVATISANSRAFPEPATPKIFNPSLATSKLVPPPTVAIGKSGRLTEKYKSPFLFSAVVIPRDPSTT